MSISLVYAQSNDARLKLKELEKSFDGSIGVYALNTANNAVIAYRSNERFPMGSTAKFMVAATMLHHADKNPDILTKKINIIELTH